MNNLMDRKWPRNSANISTYQYNNSKITHYIEIKKATAGGRRGFDIFKKAVFEKVRIADAKKCLPTGKLVELVKKEAKSQCIRVLRKRVKQLKLEHQESHRSLI